MPKRNSTKRYEGWEGQGEDSWVEIRRPTVEQMKIAQNATIPSPDDPNRELQNSKNFEAGLDILRTMVTEWNWVTENIDPVTGEPVPMEQVKDNPKVLDILTDEELHYLLNLFKGNAEEIKNSKTGS